MARERECYAFGVGVAVWWCPELLLLRAAAAFVAALAPSRDIDTACFRLLRDSIDDLVVAPGLLLLAVASRWERGIGQWFLE